MCLKRDADDFAILSYIKAGSFWTIQKNVGYGYPNYESDVLLVQFFVNTANAVVAGDHPGTYGDYFIEEDGSFGGQTWGAIKTFQKKMGCVADGMVSAATGDRLLSPKNGKVYTMYDLNRLYIQGRRPYFTDLRMDPDLPAALCNYFTVPGWND